MAQKVNVWDQAEVKNTLDDAIVRVCVRKTASYQVSIVIDIARSRVQFMIEEQKRSEDNLLSDLKLLLGVVSCVLATYAYLYPLKVRTSLVRSQHRMPTHTRATIGHSIPTTARCCSYAAARTGSSAS